MAKDFEPHSFGLSKVVQRGIRNTSKSDSSIY